MSSTIITDPLAAVLFSKNRQAVLGLLYGHPDEEFYLREIVRAAGGGMGAIQRELRELTAAGSCEVAQGRQVYFQANHDCPVFEELRAVVLKTPFVFGSVAAGSERQASDLRSGAVCRHRFLCRCGGGLLSTAQDQLRREINAAVYPPWVSFGLDSQPATTF